MTLTDKHISEDQLNDLIEKLESALNIFLELKQLRAEKRHFIHLPTGYVVDVTKCQPGSVILIKKEQE